MWQDFSIGWGGYPSHDSGIVMGNRYSQQQPVVPRPFRIRVSTYNNSILFLILLKISISNYVLKCYLQRGLSVNTDKDFSIVAFHLKDCINEDIPGLVTSGRKW